jgi:fatty acid desaturase
LNRALRGLKRLGLWYEVALVTRHYQHNAAPARFNSKRSAGVHFDVLYSKGFLPSLLCHEETAVPALGILVPCMTVYYVLVPYCFRYYPLQILWLLIIPWLVQGGGFLMFGNFSQHMFVDPDDPTSNYNLSYIIVNCPHSKLNYNDGYHLLHHINSKMHWSELPLHFLNHIEKFAQNDAMIFTDIDTKQILKLVFREHYRYDELYRYYVQIRPDPQHHRSLKEFEAIMRHRLKPIPTTVD